MEQELARCLFYVLACTFSFTHFLYDEDAFGINPSNGTRKAVSTNQAVLLPEHVEIVKEFFKGQENIGHVRWDCNFCEDYIEADNVIIRCPEVVAFEDCNDFIPNKNHIGLWREEMLDDKFSQFQCSCSEFEVQLENLTTNIPNLVQEYPGPLYFTEAFLTIQFNWEDNVSLSFETVQLGGALLGFNNDLINDYEEHTSELHKFVRDVVMKAGSALIKKLTPN